MPYIVLFILKDINKLYYVLLKWWPVEEDKSYWFDS